MQEKSSIEQRVDNQVENTRGTIRGLRILLGAILVFSGIFLVIIAVLNGSGNTSPKFQDADTQTVLLVLAVVATVAAVAVATRIYRKGVADAAALTGSLYSRLNFYRSFYIQYIALCDFAVIFSILLFMLTWDARLFFPFAIGVLALLRVTPSRSKIGRELNLSSDEIEQL